MTVRCFVVFFSTLGWPGGEWCHLVGESRMVLRLPAPSPLPGCPPFFSVLLTWGLLRLLRLICQNFGQISSLSSANRASLDRARHRRNKSQYAWKTFQRIQVVKANNFCSPSGLVITIHDDWGEKVLVKIHLANIQNSIFLYRILLQLNGFQRRAEDLEICFFVNKI